MMAGMISGDNKYIDADGVWRWIDGGRELNPLELASLGLPGEPLVASMPATGGWCAPSVEHVIATPPPLDHVDLPTFSVRRGGIRFPEDVQTVVSFHVSRPLRLRPWRWEVRARVTKTWTLHGECHRRDFDLIAARTLRRASARVKCDKLNEALW